MTKLLQLAFTSSIVDAPKVFKDAFNECIHSLERPDYHPERFLNKHIWIVYYNASMFRGDNHITRLKNGTASKHLNNLQMAALLHDVCKPRSGAFKSVQLVGETFEYWSNPYHAQEAAKLIDDNDDVQQWIIDNGADVQTVRTIVAEHMKFKSFIQGEKGIKGGMKATKRAKYAELNAEYMDIIRDFARCDDMLTTQKENPELFIVQ